MSLSGIAIEKALSFIKKFSEIINSLPKKDDYGSSFRTRIIDLPEMMLSTGLLPTLTFYYAGASKEGYNRVLSMFQESSKGDVEGVEAKTLKKEEFSYAAALLATLSYISDMGFIPRDQIEDPLKAFETLREKVPIVSQYLMPYLLELKKLSDALFKQEKGEGGE